MALENKSDWREPLSGENKDAKRVPKPPWALLHA